jgi:hypothetical protein
VSSLKITSMNFTPDTRCSGTTKEISCKRQESYMAIAT